MDGTCTARILLMLLLLTLENEYGAGLLIRQIEVPSPLVVGDSAWLECDFVEEREKVYALKWYLGLDEFYRWTPAEEPPVKTFPVRGSSPLVVDVGESNRGRVKILDVRLGATGVFRCEVSAEAPSFHTESQVKTMTVLDLPDARPIITGIQPRYQILDTVRVNCSSPRSQPPATLAFYINDNPPDPSWVVQYKPLEEGESGLETAVKGLVFPLLPHLLQRGPVLVKCTAAIMDRYWESSVEAIHSDTPYQASVMEGRASPATGCMVSSSWLMTGSLAGWLLLRFLH